MIKDKGVSMNQKFDLNIYYDVEEVKQETINEILEEHKNEFDELKKKYKTGEIGRAHV